MRGGTSRTTWTAIGGACALLVTYLVFELLGSVIVTDQTGQVVSATIIGSNGATQAMYRLPWGNFVAIPRIEGDVAIRCRDESVGRGGYVTPHMHARLEVKPGKTCSTAFIG